MSRSKDKNRNNKKETWLNQNDQIKIETENFSVWKRVGEKKSRITAKHTKKGDGVNN